MTESLAETKEINLVYSNEQLRPTPFEKSKNITTFGYIGCKPSIFGLSFNMEIQNLQEADPENLTKIAKSPLSVDPRSQKPELNRFSPSPSPLVISDTDSDITSISQFYTPGPRATY